MDLISQETKTMAFHAEICLLAVFPARIWTHTGHLPVNHNTKQTLVMLIITIINKRKTKKKTKNPNTDETLVK